MYTDINFTKKKIISNPRDSISREHAYYFIIMGFEVLCYTSILEFDSKAFSEDSDSFKLLCELMADVFSKDYYKKLVEYNIQNSFKDWKNYADTDMFPEELLKPLDNFYNKLVELDTDNLFDQKAIKFRNDRLSDLERFMERWSKTVDLSKLDFLNDPDPLLKIVNDIEGTKSLSECVTKYLTPFKISDDKKMSQEELVDFFIKKSL